MLLGEVLLGKKPGFFNIRSVKNFSTVSFIPNAIINFSTGPANIPSFSFKIFGKHLLKNICVNAINVSLSLSFLEHAIPVIESSRFKV